MTRPRDAVVVEFAASIAWDAVLEVLDMHQGDPAKWTRRYLRTFRKGDAVALERLAWVVQAQSILLRLRQDPRRIGYPIQILMRSLSRLTELSGFPAPASFAAIHNVIAPRVRGTAFGVGWPTYPEGWRTVTATDCEPVVYRKIRRDNHEPTTVAESAPS